MIAQEVLEFIERRFKIDCNWKIGNCYYFAVILAERFKSYDPVLYYNTADGHFITKINDIFYDWSGALVLSDEYVSKHIMKWSDLYNGNSLWGDRIISDAIL